MVRCIEILQSSPQLCLSRLLQHGGDGKMAMMTTELMQGEHKPREHGHASRPAHELTERMPCVDKESQCELDSMNSNQAHGSLPCYVSLWQQGRKLDTLQTRQVWV